MKNILVIGSKGMLGNTVYKYFKSMGYDVTPLSRIQFDIVKDDVIKLEPIVSQQDIVINCTGIIKQKMDEYSIEEILRVNSLFPKNLAKMCDKFGKKCFHITTDCAYSGKDSSYTESSYFDAEDVYGMSKAAGDTESCMTLRTSIIGEEIDGFRSLLSWVKSQKGKTVNGFSDHFWNGVTTLYLAEIIQVIIERNMYQKGIYHIYSKEIVSKYELVELINEIYGLGITVNKYETGSPCDRSLKSDKGLSNELCRKDLRTQITELKEFFEKY